MASKKKKILLLLAKQSVYKCKIEKQSLNVDIVRKQLLYR